MLLTLGDVNMIEEKQIFFFTGSVPSGTIVPRAAKHFCKMLWFNLKFQSKLSVFPLVLVDLRRYLLNCSATHFFTNYFFTHFKFVQVFLYICRSTCKLVLPLNLFRFSFCICKRMCFTTPTFVSVLFWFFSSSCASPNSPQGVSITLPTLKLPPDALSTASFSVCWQHLTQTKHWLIWMENQTVTSLLQERFPVKLFKPCHQNRLDQNLIFFL